MLVEISWVVGPWRRMGISSQVVEVNIDVYRVRMLGIGGDGPRLIDELPVPRMCWAA